MVIAAAATLAVGAAVVILAITLGHRAATPSAVPSSTPAARPTGRKRHSPIPSPGQGATPVPTSTAGVPSIQWYLGAPVLALLYQADPTLAAAMFNRPSTLVAVTQAAQIAAIPPGWSVTPVFTYFDESLLHAAVAGGSLDPRIKGVVLDDELAVCKVYGKSECTPAAEQRNPVPAEQDAASLAASHGLLYIDVGAAPDPQQGGNRWHAAAFASIVDSQIQLSQADQAKFAALSLEYLRGWQSAVSVYRGPAYAQVRAQPVRVLDGITAKVPSCPPGTKACTTYVPANPADMLAAVRSTQPTGVSGYWLNCPAGTTPGPGPCDATDVNVMIQFLTALQAQNQG